MDGTIRLSRWPPGRVHDEARGPNGRQGQKTADDHCCEQGIEPASFISQDSEARSLEHAAWQARLPNMMVNGRGGSVGTTGITGTSTADGFGGAAAAAAAAAELSAPS